MVGCRGRLLQQRDHPRARTYLGKGKVEELAAMVGMLKAKVAKLKAEQEALKAAKAGLESQAGRSQERRDVREADWREGRRSRRGPPSPTFILPKPKSSRKSSQRTRRPT